MVYYNLAVDQRIERRNEAVKNKKIKNIDIKIQSLESTDLNELKGVGEETIKILFENGIKSQADLLARGKDEVEKIKVPFLSKRGVMSLFNK